MNRNIFIRGERERMIREAKHKHPDAIGVDYFTRIRFERVAFSAWERGKPSVLPETCVNACGGIILEEKQDV